MGRRVRHQTLWVAWLALGAASCELAVPQANLDEVRCQQEGQVGPPACPEGKTCLGGVCVASGTGADAGPDADASIEPDGTSTGGTGGSGGSSGSAGVDAAAGSGGAVGGTGGGDGGTGGGDGGTGGEPQDAGDEPIVKRPLGELCASAADCESGVCLTVPDKPGEMRCSQYCCSSFNCPAGTVCSTFWGNQLCVDPSFVSLSTPGTGPAGSSCGDGTQCRSGRCGTDGTCKDVCCVNDSCPGGAACALTAEFGQQGWYCAGYTAASKTANGDSCSSDGECASNKCYDYGAWNQCNGPCCKDSDCGSGGFCDYFWDGVAAVRQCMTFPLAAPSANAPCCTDANCTSPQHCVPVLSSAVTSIPYYFHDNVWIFRCQ